MSEDAKTAAKRQAIEAEGNKVAPKTAEPKRSRFDRRLEKRKKEILDKLVLQYFTERSTLSDPEGQIAADFFDGCENEWKWECKTFNRGRQPFKLRYEVFSESVEFYLKMEKDQMGKTKEENEVKAFDHWFRRRRVWRTMPLTTIYFHIISLFNREKYISLYKNYYKHIKLLNNEVNR
jgi:hypothetical protein